MQTSRLLRGQVRRALLVACAFTACINALMLVAPLFALHLLEPTVPAGSTELLMVLGCIAAAALLAAALLDTCRELILLRAGLWLEHTFGQRQLAAGLKKGSHPDAIRDQARALGTLREALAGGRCGACSTCPGWSLRACWPICCIRCWGWHSRR